MRSLAVVLIIVLAAGCLDDASPAQPPASKLYHDAAEVVTNHVDGSEDTTKEFRVPDGKGFFLVMATYNVSGSAKFRLLDPAGKELQEDKVAGEKAVDNITWAQILNPAPGPWRFEIQVAGTADYVFGFYVSGNGTSLDGLYGDARLRVSNRVSGSDSSSKNIEIPVNTPKLRVKATYQLEGSGSLRLRDALLTTKQEESIAGSKDYKDGVWYEANNPLPGTWKLEISVAGSGQYAFGFYY